jgi:Zn-finger nucleic acid-binding protein
MDEVRIELTCPGCEEAFLVPAAEQGKISECPHCGGWVDVPEVGRLPNGFESEPAGPQPTWEDSRRQWEESARQLAAGARQIEQSQKALDLRDRQDERFDEILDRFTATIARWDALADQLGRVIEKLAREDGG